MQENFKNKQIKALEDLRILSQTPWLSDHQIDKLYSICKSVQSRNMQLIQKKSPKQIRPNTTQFTRKRYNFFSTQNNQAIFKFSSTSRKPNITTPNYFLCNQSTKQQPLFLRKNIRTRSQLRDKIPIKGKNYSSLRKDFEKGFYVGNMVKNQKKDHNKISFRSQKKGRLWVGRPVLLFDNQQKNNL